MCEWAAFAAEISAALRADGADRFLRLPPIAKTVHPRIRSAGRRYLAYLLRFQAIFPGDPTGAERVSGRHAARESPLPFQQPGSGTTWLPPGQVAGVDGHRPVAAAAGRGLWRRVMEASFVS